jgi:hypothetical protein
MRYNAGPWGFFMDSFVIAVLAGSFTVVAIFALLIVLDKGKPIAPRASTPAKASGKR